MLKMGKNKEQEIRKARNYALTLLDYRERSQWEIEERMHQKGCTPEAIQQVINYLKKHNFLNDRRFSEEWVNFSIKKGFARKRICYELKRKGITEDLIEEVVEKLFSKIDEVEIALKLIQKKYKILKNKKDFQRIYRFLRGRGYSFSVINEVIDKLKQKGDRSIA